MSWKVVGSNPSAGKSFSSHEISVKVYFYEHLALKFRYMRDIFSASIVSCAHVVIAPKFE